MINLFSHFFAYCILIAPLVAACVVLAVWIVRLQERPFTLRFKWHEQSDGKIRFADMEKLEDK